MSPSSHGRAVQADGVETLVETPVPKTQPRTFWTISSARPSTFVAVLPGYGVANRRPVKSAAEIDAMSKLVFAFETAVRRLRTAGPGTCWPASQ